MISGCLRSLSLIGILALCGHASPTLAQALAGGGGGYPMGRDGSGTSWVTDTSPMDGIHGEWGNWTTMVHGALTLAQTGATGPRGQSENFSTSALMLSAQRTSGSDRWTLRTMLSAEPLNGPAGYPLLFQTGETADGRVPLVDRQHPHNLFMEVAAIWSHSLSNLASVFVYAAPVGEPALGPPAFLHRASSDTDPEAPLSHHHLDATHVSFGVVTGGLVRGPFKVEASVFNGREPDQHRYALEWNTLSSWATRFSWNPTPSLALQVSTGHLRSPESLQPKTDVTRTTASVVQGGRWGGIDTATTLAVGRNRADPGTTTDGWLLDETLRFGGRHTLFGRYERVAADDLPYPSGSGQTPLVRKSSLGYQFDLSELGPVRWGVGMVVSVYGVPADLSSLYGSDPVSWTVYARARIAP